MPIQTESNLETIKNAITQFTFSDSQKEEILKAIPVALFYAVRSSVADEDGSEFSFAGQFSSYLFVTKEELFENIKLVWLSAFSERVLEYRKTNGLQINKGIAVVIQRMINAEVSGVGFGMNPINGNRKQKLISAVYGLGEGLVSGELNADTYKVSRFENRNRNCRENK
jgi:phosphoenolpyruvate synthase/pyruvate phosphate dikinase